VSYAYWDRPVADWARHLPRAWALFAHALSVVGTGGYWLVAAVLVGLTALLLDRRRLGVWALRIACALAVSGLATDLLKLLFGRARPLAAGLCLRWPAAWPGALLLWLMLAGSRVMTAAHFVSDMLAGSAVGIAAMVLVDRSAWLDRLLSRVRKVEARPAAPDEAAQRLPVDA